MNELTGTEYLIKDLKGDLRKVKDCSKNDHGMIILTMGDKYDQGKEEATE